MKNLIYILVSAVVVCLVSCEKKEIDHSNFLLSSLLDIDGAFDNVFYVGKQVVASPYGPTPYSRTSWKVSGKATNQSVNVFSVNGVDIPKTTATGFYKDFGNDGATEIQQDIYEMKVEDRTYFIDDISITLLTVEGVLATGDYITWEMENYFGEVMVVIRQNALMMDGTVIQDGRFDYAFTNGTSFRVPDSMLERFNTGDEVTVSVGMANYIKDKHGTYAVVANSYSAIYEILKHD